MAENNQSVCTKPQNSEKIMLLTSKIYTKMFRI